MNSKNKNQTKENWIEKIKCKRENHEDQLCGGCKDCQAFWGLKSLIESILKSEKAKNRQEIIKEILSKMEIEINGRDITIYELGDWLVKLKSQLKDEK